MLVVFVLVELRTPVPLIKIRIFTDRAFAVDNAVLFFSMVAFVPVFFFASVYSQVSLGYDANNAGLYLLLFFAGFAPAAQVGGRILDDRGAKPAIVARQRARRGRLRPVGLEVDRPEPRRAVVGDSSSPAPGSACCSARPARTPPTGRSTLPTARSPASPRPSGTTARRWVWRCWAPSSATSSPSRLTSSFRGLRTAARPGGGTGRDGGGRRRQRRRGFGGPGRRPGRGGAADRSGGGERFRGGDPGGADRHGRSCWGCRSWSRWPTRAAACCTRRSNWTAHPCRARTLPSR